MADRDISPPPAKRQRLPRPSLLAPSIPSRPITALSQNHLRVFSWNVNGIASFLQPSITSFFSKSPARGKERLSNHISPSGPKGNDPKRPSPDVDTRADSRTISDPATVNDTRSLATRIKRWAYPSVVCLQEVKISPADAKTQQAVRQSVKSITTVAENQDYNVGYTAHFSLPRDKFNARGFGGKVYGVCTLVRHDLLSTENVASHIRTVDWDLEGRALLLELPERRIVVFNVYAVNGTENPYRDPQTGAVTGTRHDRKRAFHTDLAEECKRYEEKRWVVVVAGDINIARSPADGFPGIRLSDAHVKNRADFERKFMSKKEGLGMLDSFRLLHGEERKYSYRSRGVSWGASCDRVDMILVSHHADKDCDMSRWDVVDGDILDEELERGPSDHVPTYATLAYRGPTPHET